MRIERLLVSAALSLLFLTSCQKSGSPGPHATVYLRDGSSAAGTVTASSATEIQLAGDDKTTHTIPMAQVRSVEYDAQATPPPASTSVPPVAPATSSDVPLPPPDPTHDNHYHPTEAALTTRTFRLPVGTRVQVRTEETIDSQRASQGQTYAAEIARDVPDSDGRVVLPRGANARIVIRSASAGGKIHGASDLVLDLASVSIAGRLYVLSTTDLVKKGREGVGVNKRTGEFAGGGAAVGAIIGAIAGGGKGAAIGAGSGAGAGTLTEILTKGHSVRVPVESILTFRLDRPLQVEAAR